MRRLCRRQLFLDHYFINRCSPELDSRLGRVFLFFDTVVAVDDLGSGGVVLDGLLHVADLAAEPAEEAFAG